MEQGTDKVVDSRVLPGRREGPRRPAADHRAGQHRRLRRVRPGAVRRPQGRPLDVRDDARRRRRVRDRGHPPRGHLRRPVPHDRRIVGGHMFSIYQKTQLHSFGERVSPYTFWWGSAPGVVGDWDFAARNLRSTRWLHARVDVDYNGWFMCLIPRDGDRRDRPVAAGLHQVGRLRVRPARQGGRLPDRELPRRGGVARPVDRQERRARLAVLLPRPQPVHLRAAALAVPARRADGPRELQPPDQAHGVMQYSTVELRHKALEDVLAGPEGLHELLPTTLPEIRRVVKGYDDAQLQRRPERVPRGQAAQAAAQGQGRRRR